MKSTPFMVLVLEGLVGLHRPSTSVSLALVVGAQTLDYCAMEWFALEMNRDHSVVFETASKYCIWDSFVDHDDYSMV